MMTHLLVRVRFCSVFAACDVVKDIQWSQELDSIFISNYQKDPTLSWQFFGSSLGFMRQFPGTSSHLSSSFFERMKEINILFRFVFSLFALGSASKWDQSPVDLFDCRLRPWYIEAAASPKDMVILVDISGAYCVPSSLTLKLYAC